VGGTSWAGGMIVGNICPPDQQTNTTSPMTIAISISTKRGCMEVAMTTSASHDCHQTSKI